MALSRDTREAVRRYGPSVNRLARNRYGISGQDLLAKLVYGESHDDPNAVSPAGARGRTQFMPQTRQEVLSKYGIDPWGTADEAVHAASLHLRGKLGHNKGLEGYNPGDPSYASYILGQPVSGPGGRSSGAGGGQQPSRQGPTAAPDLPGLQIQPGPDTAGLLASLLADDKPPAPTGQLRPSALAASAVLPAGYQGIQSSGGPAPRRDISGLLEAASGLGGALPGVTAPRVPGDAQNGREPSPEQKKEVKGGLIAEISAEADRINQAKVPYLWGGGHAAPQKRGSKVTPLDCSGAVSRVLGIDPRVSGQFENWGKPGRGRVTVYANDEHVLMEIDGHFFGTSSTNPGGGAGWIKRKDVSSSYLKNFTARHL